jgi:hypothetical protein
MDMKGSIGMSQSRVALAVVGIGVLCLSSQALADAAGDYETLFGQEEKVAAAKGTAASAEFAGSLLNAAKSASGQKELQALLCEKAYEFGIKAPVGYQAATDAMKLLIEKMPDKKLEAREKLLKVIQLRYSRSGKRDEREQLGLEQVDLLAAFGDDKEEAKQLVEAVALYRQALTLATMWKSGRTAEIMDKIKELSAEQEAERRIAVLKARLEKNPKDAAARTALIMAYLGELDSPAEAVKLLTPDVDEGLRTYVPLAAEKASDLKEAACIQLAGWLMTVAEKSSPAGEIVLLGRAKEYCERYLKLHTTEDAALLKGRMLLEKLAKAIEAAKTRIYRPLKLDLTTRTPKSAKVGYFKFMVNEAPEEVVVLRINGKECKRYFFAHAPSRLVFELPAIKVPQTFTAYGYMLMKGSVKFIVKLDGDQVYESKSLKQEELVGIKVRIKPGTKTLELIVDDEGDYTSDWAFWLEPRIE